MGTVTESDPKGHKVIRFTHEDDDTRNNEWLESLAKKHGVRRDELAFVSEQTWREEKHISLEVLNERSRDGKDGVPIEGTIHLIRRPH